jgi:DNA-binding transcriptional LysR family regulator
MRSLNLDQLRTFLAVAETGSFSEAGRRLSLTQSAVSQQVKELEARLGVRVLDRLGKRAHPTTAGEDLRRHARSLLQQADLVTEAMRTHRDGGWARVRVATSATLAAYVLPPLLLDLRKRYPRLEVTVVAGPVKDVLRRVVNNEADLAFANNPAPPADPALAIDVVCQSSLMAFWPKALGAPPAAVSPEHLVDKAFMFYTPGTHTNELVRRWFEQGQCAPAAAMELDSGLSILPLVQAGLGVSILPAEVRIAIKGLDQVIVRPLDPPIPSQVYVAMHKDKPRNEALRVLHAALLALRFDEPRRRTRVRRS